jgi:hypothetical protein
MLKKIRLYKYLPFNDGSLKILSEGTIKFTKPSEFNDPFDCDPEYDIANIDKYLESRPDIVKKALKYRNAKCRDIHVEIAAMTERLENAINHGHLGQEAADNVGICSLTMEPLNLLMWAHYAQNHTGFVVEFEIPVEGFYPADYVKYLEWLIPQVVEYEWEKPIVKFGDDQDTKMKKQFLVKGKDWQYEEEHRVIDFIRKSGIHKYDRSTILKSVIAGIKIDPKNYDKLKNTVSDLKSKGLKIELFQAKRIKGEYGVYVEERPDLKRKNIS